MASFTLEEGPWSPGASVSAYLGAAWPAGAVEPSGPAISSGTADAYGGVEFAGVQERVRYVAFAESRGVRFLVPASEASSGGDGGGGSGNVDVNQEAVGTGWPERPESELVIWQGWSNPADLMEPLDLFIAIPDPS